MEFFFFILCCISHLHDGSLHRNLTLHRSNLSSRVARHSSGRAAQEDCDEDEQEDEDAQEVPTEAEEEPESKKSRKSSSHSSRTKVMAPCNVVDVLQCLSFFTFSRLF